MQVRSSVQCGFRQNGEHLLNEGLTTLDDGALTFGEREFINAMVEAKLAEIVTASEPGLRQGEVIPLSSARPKQARRPMRTRKARGG